MVATITTNDASGAVVLAAAAGGWDGSAGDAAHACSLQIGRELPPAVQSLVAEESPQTVPVLSATVVLKAFRAVVSNWVSEIPPR